MTKEKLIPELRFPEFKGEWEKKKLGEVVNFKKGKGIPKRELSDYGKKCILYGELYTKYNEIINEVDSYTRLDTKKLRLSKSGDILIPSSGETALDMSLSSALLLDDIALGGDINILRPKKKLIDSVFLSYQINTARKLDLARKAEGASVVHLYNSNLEKLKISYPSIKEQYKIANFFSSIDKKIQLQEELIENLEEQKKDLMQKIFNQEVRFKDENGKDYPEWRKERIDNLIIEKNKRFTGKKYPLLSSTLNGIYLQTDYFDRSVASLDLKNYKVISLNEFTYRSMSDTGDFKFNIQNIVESGLVSPAYPVFDFKDIHVNNKYMYLALNYDDFFKRQLGQILQGGTRLSLPLSRFKSLKVHLPVREEQDKIADLLFLEDKKINSAKKELENYKEYKKGLMQRMFI